MKQNACFGGSKRQIFQFAGIFMPFRVCFAPFVGNHFYNCMTQLYICSSKSKSELKMRKLVTIFTSLLLMASSIKAQQITGTVKDEKGKGLEKATVSLLKAKDSSVVKLVATGDNGVYSFNTIQTGRYLVNISYVGYAQTYSEAFDFTGSTVTMPAITISKPSGDLAGVVVTSKNQ